MFPANDQIISRLVLLVVAAVLSNAASTVSNSASGGHSACAEIASAYAQWIANEGESLLA